MSAPDVRTGLVASLPGLDAEAGRAALSAGTDCLEAAFPPYEATRYAVLVDALLRRPPFMADLHGAGPQLAARVHEALDAQLGRRTFLAEREAFLEDLLARHALPVTGSIISDDLGRDPRAVEMAKKIFSLAHVEAASHSASHPLDWTAAGVDAAREVAASVRELNARAMPEGRNAA